MLFYPKIFQYLSVRHLSFYSTFSIFIFAKIFWCTRIFEFLKIRILNFLDLRKIKFLHCHIFVYFNLRLLIEMSLVASASFYLSPSSDLACIYRTLILLLVRNTERNNPSIARENPIDFWEQRSTRVVRGERRACKTLCGFWIESGIACKCEWLHHTCFLAPARLFSFCLVLFLSLFFLNSGDIKVQAWAWHTGRKIKPLAVQ